jgi:ferrous iron transport protein B
MIGMLFGDRPLLAGLAFTGCYILGAIAALLTALLFRKTILRGPSTPMLLELPTYKMPSLRTAVLTTYDRAVVFLKKAGTVIVAICVVLWWMGEYPHSAPPPEAMALRAEANDIQQSDAEQAAALNDRADRLEAKSAKANSFIGRIGRGMEPVFKPLGYDWQLSIGVLSSLVAREVFVSTMSVVLTGAEDDPNEDAAMRDRIVQARRSDGGALFTTAAAASLLVYYVLAMQCLPTLAVTRRETGSWKWAALQLFYMTGLAYLAAMAVYHVLLWAGVS